MADESGSRGSVRSAREARSTLRNPSSKHNRVLSRLDGGELAWFDAESRVYLVPLWEDNFGTPTFTGPNYTTLEWDTQALWSRVPGADKAGSRRARAGPPIPGTVVSLTPVQSGIVLTGASTRRVFRVGSRGRAEVTGWVEFGPPGS